MSTTGPLVFAFAELIDDAVAFTEDVNGSSVRWRSRPSRMKVRVDISSMVNGGQTIAFTLETSPDGVTWFSTGVSTTGINANGTFFKDINKPVMPYLRLAYTESASGPSCTISAWILADTPATPSSRPRKRRRPSMT